MKREFLHSVLITIVLLLVFHVGFGQQHQNPFSVKQKVPTNQTDRTVNPKPLNDQGFTNTDKGERSQSYPNSNTYSSKAFIQPGAVNQNKFSSLRYDENGLIIFAESNPGTEKHFNSRSDDSRIEACYTYLAGLKKAMRITDPVNEFQEKANWDDNLGMVHIKLQQYYEGIKVYGGQIILHGQTGMISKMNGTYYPTPMLTDLIPTVDEQQVIANAINDLRTATFYKELDEFEKAFLDYHGPELELIIYHDSRDLTSEKLAYRIVIRPNVIDHWVSFVDAKSGAIIEKYNMTCTDGPATAQAQDLNGVTQTIHTYQVGGQYYFIDASRPMFNVGQSQLPDNPVGAIWTLDANNTNEQNIQLTHIVSSDNSWNNPTAVSAHNSAAITYEYFKNTHSRNSIDGQGGTIISIINITDDDGSGKDNAFWNGRAMFYGNGDQLFYPLAGALDVGAHEMAHGVTQHTANLIYKDQSGAINEAMSDIVGCMVDRDNWRLAEDVVLPNSQYFPSGAMRDMSNPHNGATDDLPGWQPQHTNEMYTGDQDNGGVHTNSGIINYAYYMIAEAISKDKAEDIYYRALANYMTQSSQFIDCRLAFEQAAKDIHGDGSAEFNAVVTAFFNVGIGDENGGGDGSGPPGELPQNPGQDYIMFADEYPGGDATLTYVNTETSEFFATTSTPVLRKPSITDDGSAAVFIAENKTMRGLNLTTNPPQEWEISAEKWDNVAASKDGRHITAITTNIDSSIYVYNFEKEQWAKFKLYNPTFSEGVFTYNVLYADALEFDYSGEYLIYDAYNELKNDNGENIDYWDMGIIRVWNNSTNNWGDGEIFKLYPSLPEGVNIGNPSLSKNSPYIMAYDYFDNNTGNTYVLAANLETGTIETVYENQILGFPNYSIDDKNLVFSALDNDNNEVVGIIDMKTDKITPEGEAALLIEYAKWPVWFATGIRDLSDVNEDDAVSYFTKIYPNPFSTEINVVIEIPYMTDYKLAIFDMFGKKMKEVKGKTNGQVLKETIELSDLSKGTYFIRIIIDEKVTSKKIVKIN